MKTLTRQCFPLQDVFSWITIIQNQFLLKTIQDYMHIEKDQFFLNLWYLRNDCNRNIVSGDKCSMSIVPTFGKMFEIILINQLKRYFVSNDLLNTNHNRFRGHISSSGNLYNIWNLYDLSNCVSQKVLKIKTQQDMVLETPIFICLNRNVPESYYGEVNIANKQRRSARIHTRSFTVYYLHNDIFEHIKLLNSFCSEFILRWVVLQKISTREKNQYWLCHCQCLVYKK